MPRETAKNVVGTGSDIKGSYNKANQVNYYNEKAKYYGNTGQYAKANAATDYANRINGTYQGTPSYSGGGGYETQSYDYSGLIEALQKIAQEKYQALEDALLRNRQTQDDSVNKRYAMDQKRWSKMYGDGKSGQGMSSLWNIRYGRDNDLRENETNYLNNLATVKSNKYDDYSNLASSLSGIDSNSLQKILKMI